MKKSYISSEGSVIIETSIVLPLFMFVFLFIYGIFGVINTQNQVTHALIQSSKSLSMDSYLTENVSSVTEKDTFWNSFGQMILDLKRSENSIYYTTTSDWYDTGGNSNLAKFRFIGFFSGGDKNVADEKLKTLGVTNGIDGMNFEMTVNGNDMTIKLNYEIQIWFDAFDLGKIPIEQEITTRLWK